ncbi:hypothetical protein G6F37_005447 [Rhizopus arrhizus]|nr:hypothetical protein G6F38_005137 [Rhizopus arrhizus]KAG1158825.1 hypothetical protein G6F37_005447 [Rhizopus arrhizus]
MPELSTLTEEQLRRIEANKARALEKLKAKRQARELEEKKEERPLKRARWIKSYYEYDLSKMIDSKGGFIVEEDKIKEEKKNRYVPEPYYRKHMKFDLENELTVLPQLPLILQRLRNDYLLTDPELKDTELLPHWSKPNPHKSTWNDMMLYVREMVEAYAFKKWNGPEGLDAEYERREAQKKAKKEKKFKEKLADLRRRTLTTSRERQRQEGPHKHLFDSVVQNKEGQSMQKCSSCGLVIEAEEL